MFQLQGKRALVTGASGGIGGAIARALHGAGAAVALSGTREDALQALAAELGERTAVLPANLSDPEVVGGLRGLMRQRWGRIVNITSIVGVTGNPGQTNYAASKAGLIGFSKSLAAEVASRNITVNCIAPGFIATPMTDALGDAQREKLLQSIPAGRLGQSEDIAAGALYLASEEAGYITGQTLHINGGMAMI